MNKQSIHKLALQSIGIDHELWEVSAALYLAGGVGSAHINQTFTAATNRITATPISNVYDIFVYVASNVRESEKGLELRGNEKQ